MIRALILTALMAGTAHAKCIRDDRWTGPDKTKHFAIGAAIGAAGTIYTGKPEYGFYAGTAVGLAKELFDSRGSGTCSFQDFAMTAAGAALGAYGSKWVLGPNYIGYRWEF